MRLTLPAGSGPLSTMPLSAVFVLDITVYTGPLLAGWHSHEAWSMDNPCRIWTKLHMTRSTAPASRRTPIESRSCQLKADHAN
jgi:hypothetical protein